MEISKEVTKQVTKCQMRLSIIVCLKVWTILKLIGGLEKSTGKHYSIKNYLQPINQLLGKLSLIQAFKRTNLIIKMLTIKRGKGDTSNFSSYPDSTELPKPIKAADDPFINWWRKWRFFILLRKRWNIGNMLLK